MSAKVKKQATCTTGVPGLDHILGGGLPAHRVYLVQGDPGVGKTTLALQFLLEGVRLGEKVLYITLSETKDEIEAVAASHGWSVDKIDMFELSAMEAAGEELESTFFHPSEVLLNKTTKMLLERVEKVQPRRVVFDSLSEMRMLAETPLRYRRQILAFKQFFAGRQTTVLFLDDRTSGSHDLQVESIAHGVLCLHRSSPEYGATRRQLNILKVRGAEFQEGNHDFVLRQGGMILFPRLVAAEHLKDFPSGSFTTGVTGLDALLGGGLDRGTSNMFMGPPGTGKSTTALKYAVVAASRGERVEVFTFDETIRTLMGRSKALGMDVQPYVDNDLIRIQTIDPAAISPGELAQRVRESVQNDKTRMVIIDSINGYLNTMPQERTLSLQLHELLAYLNQQGVVTIMVLAQQGLMGSMQSVVDLTYLADTVLLFRFFEYRGVVKQAISVIKKRSGNHERSIREFKVGKDGIEVGPPLTAFHGVLTGVPTAIEAEKEIEK
jgi:circadian clock protein KaiC